MFQRAQEIAAQPYQAPPTAGFNEADYLAKNPDVAAAVQGGAFKSGLEHYQQYGFKESRPGAPQLVAPFSADQQAAFEATRQIGQQAQQNYEQMAAATQASIIPETMGQIQGMAGTLGGLAQQGAQFLPGLQTAAQQGAQIAGQAGGYTAPQAQALSAAQGFAGQTGQFTPAQAAGLQMGTEVAGQAGALLPIGQQAAGVGQGLANVGTGLLPTTLSGTMGLAQAFPGVNIGAYMNPYTEQVLAPALEDLAERAAIQQNALNSRAAMTGSFGGSRNALAQQQFNRDLQRETGRLAAQEYARAFDVGAQQFRTDQAILPALYNQAFGQLASAQGLQRGASDLGTAALGQLGQAQGLAKGVSELGLLGLAGLQAGQNLQRGVADIAQTGLQGLGAAQGLQRGAADLNLAGLQGISAQQQQQAAPAALLQQAANLENQRLGQLSGLSAANAGLLATQVNPLLATGGMQQALDQAARDRMDALAAQQQNFPLRGFEVLRSALSPQAGQTTVATTQAPRPNATAQTAGLIMGGLSSLPSIFQGASALYGAGKGAYNWLSDQFATYPSVAATPMASNWSSDPFGALPALSGATTGFNFG
jgi:hypothetical protein